MNRRQMIEEMNYRNDPRVVAAKRGDWYSHFDAGQMRVLIEVHDYDEDEDIAGWVPVHYEVCHLCSGRGSHVNPSIDCGGLASEDFDADPGFHESYFRGDYDVPCAVCRGRRVEPLISRDGLSDEQQKLVDIMDQKAQDDADYEAEMAAERRMGC